MLLVIATAIMAVAVMLPYQAFAETVVVDVNTEDAGSTDRQNPVADNITRLYVNKLEKGSRDSVKGAVLCIIEEATGKTVRTWTSNGEPYEVSRNDGTGGEGLNVDTVYILKELSAPAGYEDASNVKQVRFILKSNENFNTTGMILKDTVMEPMDDHPNADCTSQAGSGPEQAFILNMYNTPAPKYEEIPTPGGGSGGGGNPSGGTQDNTSNANKNAEGLTKTGDDTNYTPVIVIAVIGAIVIAGAIIWRRKK